MKRIPILLFLCCYLNVLSMESGIEELSKAFSELSEELKPGDTTFSESGSLLPEVLSENEKTWRNFFEAYSQFDKPDQTPEKRLNQLKDIINKYDVWLLPEKRYIFIKELVKGNREFIFIRNLENLEKNEKKKTKKELTDLYKIHLMPNNKDTLETLITILEALNTDEELQKLVAEIKLFQAEELAKPIDQLDVFPRIVIYPSSGKENAQKALDIIYQILGEQEGMDITPRYNAKVTSLIYVAQGDADDKNLAAYKKYYEQPNMIYYNSKVMEPKKLFSRKKVDYYLKHPKTGKELISPN